MIHLTHNHRTITFLFPTPVFSVLSFLFANQRPPGPFTDKDKWINTERLRWATYFSVPMVQEVPKGFPHLTLSVMRAICALVVHQTAEPQPQMASPAVQKILIAALDAFYDAYWLQGRVVTEKDVLGDVLGKILTAEGVAGQQVAAQVDKVLALAATEGKQILQANTDKAYAEGAFGLPWMVCESDEGGQGKRKEGFWGVDHLGMVVDFLGLEKPRGGGWRAML